MFGNFIKEMRPLSVSKQRVISGILSLIFLIIISVLGFLFNVPKMVMDIIFIILLLINLIIIIFVLPIIGRSVN
jgi:membrane protein YdbS with pleckstrin-like domain